MQGLKTSVDASPPQVEEEVGAEKITAEETADKATFCTGKLPKKNATPTEVEARANAEDSLEQDADHQASDSNGVLPANKDAESSTPEPVAASPNKAETIGLIQQSTTWSIVLGALMMVLGVAAISLPLVTSLSLTLWIGWLLVGNSIIKLIYALQTRQQGSFWLKLLLTGLYLAAGVVLIINPLEGVLTLTLLLGSFLVAEGVVELLLTIQMRSRSKLAVASC